MRVRLLTSIVAVLGIVVAVLMWSQLPASARGLEQDSPWICVERIDYDDGVDTYPAFKVSGSGEIWIIDVFAQDDIREVFGFFPEIGQHAVLREPNLSYFDDGPPMLFGVYRFMEIDSCEPEYFFVNLDDEVIELGQCTTVYWKADAVSVTLDSQDVDPSGSLRVCPTATATYVLRARTDWWSREEAVTLEVRTPEPSTPQTAITDVTSEPEPPPASSPEISEPPMLGKLSIDKPTVNLRAGPGTNYEILGTARKGQIFDIVGGTSNGAWWQVCCYSGSKVWVSNSVVLVEKSEPNSEQVVESSSVPENTTCGFAAIFLDPKGAVWAGHVAFGVWDIINGQTFWGSVDGVTGDNTIACRAYSDRCGAYNKVWVSVKNAYVWREVFDEMASKGYSKVKYLPLKGNQCNFTEARSKANAQYDQVYALTGRNCADAVVDVLSAFGVHLPSLKVHVAPTLFYDALEQDRVTGQYWVEELLAGKIASDHQSGDPQPVNQQPTSLTPSQLIADFESQANWTVGDQKYGTLVQSGEQVHTGSYSGKLDYAFPAEADNFVVFRYLRGLAGEPKELTTWVYGNESNHILNAWVQDSRGTMWQISFGRVNFAGWQQMTAPVNIHQGWPHQRIAGPDSGEIAYPIKFFGLVLDGVPDNEGSEGTMYVDDIFAE